jgi:uncharacterized protein with GYD domain
MVRYVVLLKLTESGIASIRDSIARAEGFRSEVAEAGGRLESVYWTVGPYDGMFVLEAPDEATASALVLGLGESHSVETCTLRALDSGEFKAVLDKMS